MAIASGAGQRFAYIPQAALGAIPATPAWQIIRATGGGLRTTKVTGTSDDIRADRNVSDEFLLGLDGGGSFPFELHYGGYDGIIERALFSAWVSNVIKNGTTRGFLAFETTRELGATDSFSRYLDVMVNRMTFEIGARAKITGTLDLLARSEALATAIVAGATYVAATDNPVMSSSAHVAALTIPGGGTPKVRSLTVEINNNLRTRPVVASLFSEEFGEGKCEVTGSIDIYFEGNTLYQAFLDHSAGAIEFTVGVDTGEKYTFEMPNVKFSTGEIPPATNDEDIMVRTGYRALFDAAEAASIKITRAVA